MSYVIVAYRDIDDGDVLANERRDSSDEAFEVAGNLAEELNNQLNGNGINRMDGAPDFVQEISISGTNAVVIVKDGDLM